MHEKKSARHALIYNVHRPLLSSLNNLIVTFKNSLIIYEKKITIFALYGSANDITKVFLINLLSHLSNRPSFDLEPH